MTRALSLLLAHWRRRAHTPSPYQAVRVATIMARLEAGERVA